MLSCAVSCAPCVFSVAHRSEVSVREETTAKPVRSFHKVNSQAGYEIEKPEHIRYDNFNAHTLLSVYVHLEWIECRGVEDTGTSHMNHACICCVHAL